jgi:hypothetical protein
VFETLVHLLVRLLRRLPFYVGDRKYLETKERVTETWQHLKATLHDHAFALERWVARHHDQYFPKKPPTFMVHDAALLRCDATAGQLVPCVVTAINYETGRRAYDCEYKGGDGRALYELDVISDGQQLLPVPTARELARAAGDARHAAAKQRAAEHAKAHEAADKAAAVRQRDKWVQKHGVGNHHAQAHDAHEHQHQHHAPLPPRNQRPPLMLGVHARRPTRFGRLRAGQTIRTVHLQKALHAQAPLAHHPALAAAAAAARKAVWYFPAAAAVSHPVAATEAAAAACHAAIAERAAAPVQQSLALAVVAPATESITGKPLVKGGRIAPLTGGCNAAVLALEGGEGGAGGGAGAGGGGGGSAESATALAAPGENPPVPTATRSKSKAPFAPSQLFADPVRAQLPRVATGLRLTLELHKGRIVVANLSPAYVTAASKPVTRLRHAWARIGVGDAVTGAAALPHQAMGDPGFSRPATHDDLAKLCAAIASHRGRTIPFDVRHRNVTEL